MMRIAFVNTTYTVKRESTSKFFVFYISIVDWESTCQNFDPLTIFHIYVCTAEWKSVHAEIDIVVEEQCK